MWRQRWSALDPSQGVHVATMRSRIRGELQLRKSQYFSVQFGRNPFIPRSVLPVGNRVDAIMTDGRSPSRIAARKALKDKGGSA